ncbi:hypothetical protein D7X55_31335 [Corallococcus sp. AB049A]|uniref:Lipoprotein n=1 Tax=Corallococcus interemptor TaxID=2316720 RepID=A0A3A8QJF8_9BACT|nr:hypothetical protein [Corallococcus interemptor]RKH68846.1 hypothetical protein D7X96_16655 [Corallococcus interemptor]RKI53343.1 hypothetical protein D7X55_31335 [Corallococcus sp. AB049A]
MRGRVVAAGCIAVLAGCAAKPKAWTTPIEWPDETSATLVGQPMDAGAVVAAASAVREFIRTNPDPTLFQGCSSPELGLAVSVFTGPTQGLYFVAVHQDFRRCGGPRIRMLDAWDAYAVTPQGEVLAKAPPPAGDASFAVPPPVPDVQPPSTPPAPEPGPGGDAERSSGTVTE